MSNTYIVGDYADGVSEVVAGTNITVTGSKNMPIINSSGGGGGGGLNTINSLTGSANNINIISSLSQLSVTNNNPTIDIKPNNFFNGTTFENCMLRYRGVYNNTVTYYFGDIVTYLNDNMINTSAIEQYQTGFQFVCCKDGTINVDPPDLVNLNNNMLQNNDCWRYFNKIINNYIDPSSTTPNVTLRYRGLYDPKKYYSVGDLVRGYNKFAYDGQLFICSTANTGEALPPQTTSNSYWLYYSALIFGIDTGVNGINAYPRFMGIFDPTYTYAIGDCVQLANGGTIYMARVQTTGQTPNTSGDWYMLVSNTTNPSFRPSYTIYVANNGNDTTGNGSKTNPFQTITKACSFRTTISDAIEVNIYIESGNYTESFTISTGRTYLTCDITSEARESVNIAGNITINIPSISTIGTEYVVGLSGLQINGSINAQASASGAFVLSLYECNINTGNLVLSRTGASGSTCVVENCRFNPTGDISTIVNSGFTLQLIGSQIITVNTTQPVVVIANAPSIASAGSLIMEYSYIVSNSPASTVGSLIKYMNTSSSTGNRIGWSRLSYSVSTLDTGTGNKCCVQYVGTASVTFDYVNHNIFECDGATVGGGNPHIWQKLGAGTVTLTYEGGNLCGTLANKYDTLITKTSLVSAS